MLKADLTREGTPAVEALRQKFGIRGVPTTVFLGPNGSEHSKLRRVEYVTADEILKLMDQAVLPAPVTPGTGSAPDLPAEALPSI
jgi:thioredoxin:protein disulfide reductase